MVKIHINRFSFWRTALGCAAGLAAGMPGVGLGMFAIFPVIWGAASSRQNAFAIALAYYLASSRGVFTGAPFFFGGVGHFRLYGLLLWLGTAIALSAPWGILFCKNGPAGRKTHFFLLALATVALPPLGFLGWSHPILSTGYLLPGFGVIGIVLLVLFWLYMVVRGNSTDIVCACIAVAILSAYNATSVPLAASAERVSELKHMISEAEATRPKAPETIARRWMASANLFSSDVFESEGMKVGVLTSFEPYIFMPCLITMMNSPDVLLISGDPLMPSDANLLEYSNQCVASWSRLFGVPAVLAKNM